MIKQIDLFQGATLTPQEKYDLEREKATRLLHELNCIVISEDKKMKFSNDDIKVGMYMKTATGRIEKISGVFKNKVSFVVNKFEGKSYTSYMNKTNILGLSKTRIELLTYRDLVFIGKINGDYFGWVYVDSVFTGNDKKSYAAIKHNEKTFLITDEQILNIKTRKMLNTYDSE